MEGTDEPWAAKIGSIFYIIAILFPHAQVGLKEYSKEPKGVSFNIFINLCTLLYTIAGFLLALSPTFVGWKLALPLFALGAWIVAYVYFKMSNRGPTFTSFFVSLISGVVRSNFITIWAYL